jgi:glycosyltransferase involved in cell wall biosynthesis
MSSAGDASAEISGRHVARCEGAGREDNAAPRRLVMLTRYGRLGASSRQRCLLFAEPLRQRGIHVREHQFLSDAYLRQVYGGRPIRRLEILGRYASRILALCRSSRSDVLWVEKEVLPWMPAWLERLLVGRRILIVDFDDGWHLRYLAGDAPWHARFMASKLEALAGRADVAFVANRELLRWAHEAGARNAVLVPTIVDIDRYPVHDESEGPFTIGWIGTPLTLRYLRTIIAPLRRLSAQGARLLIIGSASDLVLPGVTVEAVPWSEATESEQIARCHVGIMPLDDTPWERFKSGYKLIQYMAAGRAVVASPVGANLDIVQRGETGLFARTDDEWFDALATLRDNPQLRRGFGVAGRRRAASHFSLTVALGHITEALAALPGAAGPPQGGARRVAA